jgi:hypothetical protein
LMTGLLADLDGFAELGVTRILRVRPGVSGRRVVNHDKQDTDGEAT